MSEINCVWCSTCGEGTIPGMCRVTNEPNCPYKLPFYKQAGYIKPKIWYSKVLGWCCSSKGRSSFESKSPKEAFETWRKE